MSLTQVHGAVANSALLFMLVCSVWALLTAARGTSLSGSFWGALVIGEGLLVVQGLIGAILWLEGRRPVRGGMHLLYGVLCVIALPAAFAYLRGREGRREALLFALAVLFTFGLIARAITTG